MCLETCYTCFSSTKTSSTSVVTQIAVLYLGSDFRGIQTGNDVASFVAVVVICIPADELIIFAHGAVSSRPIAVQTIIVA